MTAYHSTEYQDFSRFAIKSAFHEDQSPTTIVGVCRRRTLPKLTSSTFYSSQWAKLPHKQAGCNWPAVRLGHLHSLCTTPTHESFSAWWHPIHVAGLKAHAKVSIKWRLYLSSMPFLGFWTMTNAWVKRMWTSLRPSNRKSWKAGMGLERRGLRTNYWEQPYHSNLKEQPALRLSHAMLHFGGVLFVTKQIMSIGLSPFFSLKSQSAFHKSDERLRKASRQRLWHSWSKPSWRQSNRRWWSIQNPELHKRGIYPTKHRGIARIARTAANFNF